MDVVLVGLAEALVEKGAGWAGLGLFLLIWWRVARNGNGKHGEAKTFELFKKWQAQSEEQTAADNFRAMIDHEIKVVAPERHAELMRRFDEVMSRQASLEERVGGLEKEA